jgi:hypothetical protein
MRIKDVFMKDTFITLTKGGEIFESDGDKNLTLGKMAPRVYFSEFVSSRYRENIDFF